MATTCNKQSLQRIIQLAQCSHPPSSSSSCTVTTTTTIPDIHNSWKTPGGVFQAYGSYWPEGYIAHLAWAATWMCKYDSSMCSTAVQWWNTASSTNNLRYGLGYDWDSTFPGVAALVISMGLQPLVDPARQYLEGYILAKWAVSLLECFFCCPKANGWLKQTKGEYRGACQQQRCRWRLRRLHVRAPLLTSHNHP